MGSWREDEEIAWENEQRDFTNSGTFSGREFREDTEYDRMLSLQLRTKVGQVYKQNCSNKRFKIVNKVRGYGKLRDIGEIVVLKRVTKYRGEYTDRMTYKVQYAIDLLELDNNYTKIQ